jgi:MoaA/NifB/PqqE/SkfB family radical SAM enzyme
MSGEAGAVTPGLLDRFAGELRQLPVPAKLPGARLALAGHVAANAWAHRARPHGLRRALAQAAFMEVALRTFGRWGMFGDGESFYPLSLMPDFHGSHFDEALRRLLSPERGPFVVHLAVTGSCPCRCAYCYADAGGPDPPDLGDEPLVAAARALAESGVPLVILSGGEPLTRLDRALRLIEILAPHSEVRLATSGIGLTPQRAARLHRAGLTALAVSLDSADPRRVDADRGYPGAFDAAVAALRCAAGAGLHTFVTSVVGREAFRSPVEVDRFLGFVRAQHPGLVVNFIPRFAAGRAGADGFCSPSEYAPVARRIARVIRRGGYRATVFLDPFELVVGCVGGGLRQLHVDVRGNLTACISGATFGNLADAPLDVLLRRTGAAGARLKRGFLCATTAARTRGGRVLDPDDSRRALTAFYAAHEDTVFQQLIDRVGPAFAWLAAE